MATRSEVQERRTALRNDIHVSHKNGLLRVGMPVPSVRELATRFGLSRQVAHQEVQRMVEEGLLYSVPGSGTYIGTPPTRTDNFFLIVDAYESALATGFAQKVATLGGASLSLPREEINARARMHALPSLAGVWDSMEGRSQDLPWGPVRREVPRVGSIGHLEDPDFTDGVGVDNFDGGKQAALHLIRLGHRRIAYLGIHSGNRRTPQQTAWSVVREDGWRSAMEEANLPTQGLAFYPEEPFAPQEDYWHAPWSLSDAAHSASRYLAARHDITAVVAANDDAALIYVQTLHTLQVPVERWPALVGYDNLPNPKGQILSSFHRPLDQVGAAAAEILWDRQQGVIPPGTPIRCLIPMILLPRVTSESGWALRMRNYVSILLQPSPEKYGSPAATEAA